MNIKLLRIILTSLLLGGAWTVERNMALPMWQMLSVYLVPYLLISYDVLGEAIEGICEGDPFDEDFLMSVATIGALLIGFLPGAESQFPEAVFVMLFFQVGELFEDYAEDQSRRSISKLMDIRPDTACVERDGQLVTVDPESVSVGETIVVKPGDKVPMDAVVTEGSSSLDTVALTGESVPQSVTVGDELISGCVNLSGLLKARVKMSFGESTASRVIDLVENAGARKSKSETFISRFAHVYTPIVVFAALFIAFVPPLFSDSYLAAFTVWGYRALTFLVVSCPCALVISVPLTFFGGIGGASRKGILIKGGNYIDALAKTSTVVFDKTGTLTKGVFKVQAVHQDKYSEEDLLHLAAHVERYSTHPIAVALRQVYPKEADNCRVESVEEISGHGIKAQINGRQVCVGNEKMMADVGAVVSECPHCKDIVAGTVVHVAVEGHYAGHIVIADQVKDDSAETVRRLKKFGVRTVMLTGDRGGAAMHVAKQLGLDEYHAGLLPAEKVAHVEQLLQEQPGKRTLAFVGDGINDAPVLARADVGIAMGGLGSDAAIEAADVVLMDDKPSKIGQAIRLARRTIRIAKENAWFAIIIKVAVLLLATVGWAGMGLAVFADVGVMILAVLNAMRTLRA